MVTIKSVFNFIFRNLDVLIYFAIHTFSISEKAGTEHTSRCPVPALLIQSSALHHPRWLWPPATGGCGFWPTSWWWSEFPFPAGPWGSSSGLPPSSGRHPGRWDLMAASASLLAKDTTASATAFLISSGFMIIYLLESAVHKGEGARLAGKGSHCRCETYPPSIRTVPLPFQGRTTMVQWNSRTWISRSRLWSSQAFRPRSSSTRWTIWRGFWFEKWGCEKMIFTSPSLVTSRWKPAWPQWRLWWCHR